MIPSTTTRYFQPAGEGEWHIYHEDNTTALCGEVQLTYNVDPIADAVPASGTLHQGCREALDAEQAPAAKAPAKTKGKRSSK